MLCPFCYGDEENGHCVCTGECVYEKTKKEEKANCIFFHYIYSGPVYRNCFVVCFVPW